MQTQSPDRSAIGPSPSGVRASRGTWSRRTQSRRRAIQSTLITALLALGTSGLTCHKPPIPSPVPPAPIPPPPAPPPVSRLEVVPSVFQVQVDNSFELTSRAFDQNGHVVPILGAGLVWTVEGADPAQITLIASQGNEARFRADKVAGTPVKIVATLGAVSALATATVIPFPPAASTTEPIDIIEAPHEVEAPLEFSLIHGERNTKPVEDEFVAFAAGARLENLKGRGTLAVFSTARRLSYTAVNDWGEGQQTVTAPAGTHPVTIPLHLWDATNDGLLAFMDFSVAQLVYRTNRTGIRFERANGEGLPTRLAPATVFAEDCLNPEGRFGNIYDPAALALHVFVVQSVEYDLRGWACNPDPVPTRKARVIFLGVGRFSTTLAHELGHIFALLEPFTGHSDCSPGFNQANLMWRYLDDQYAINRLDLSLGQAFRIAADQRSWVTTLGHGAVSTPPSCKIDGSPCPPLSHPVLPPDIWIAPDYCIP